MIYSKYWKKKLPARSTVFVKAFLDKQKLRLPPTGVHHLIEIAVRNTERSFSSWNKMMLISNMKIYNTLFNYEQK